MPMIALPVKQVRDLLDWLTEASLRAAVVDGSISRDEANALRRQVTDLKTVVKNIKENVELADLV